MGLEKLQEKISKDFFFSKKIKKEEEELFIMRYKVLTRSIKGLTDSFIIDVKRLKELLLTSGAKSYCKFYYLEENNSLNIGLSFSDNEDCPLLKNDILYILNNELFIKTDFNNFSNLVNAFNIGIGRELVQHTNVTTNLVSYDFETVETYITTLELHFPINQLKFNMFQYRSTDLNGNILDYFISKNDKISFCVHALINNVENKNIQAESDGYDLGNLRP